MQVISTRVREMGVGARRTDFQASSSFNAVLVLPAFPARAIVTRAGVCEVPGPQALIPFGRKERSAPLRESLGNKA